MTDKSEKPAAEIEAEKEESTLSETIKTIVYAIIIAFVVRTFAFEPFNIPSGSMIPTLLIGDYLFVSKYSYGYSRYSMLGGFNLFEGRIGGSLPERGDVAVFKLPRDNRTDYIKRIIGLPGDRIQVTDGVLYLNGEAVERTRIEDFTTEARTGREVVMSQFIEELPNGKRYRILDQRPNAPLDNTEIFTVPAGHLFAMGDNRDNSLDSRAMTQVGFVPIENLVGRAEFIFFSIDHVALDESWLNGPLGLRLDRFFTGINRSIRPDETAAGDQALPPGSAAAHEG